MQINKQKTLADVARAAGVSKMTASRALRGDVHASDASSKKVKKAAKEIGYSGNHLAASLSGKRSDLIGVVVPSIANVVFAEALSGITEALAGQTSQPVFGVTDYDLDRETAIIRNMLSWRPSGLILTGLEHNEDTRALLNSAGIPIVEMMDTDGDPIDACVGLSHIDAGYDMAQALIKQGRRRIAYAGRNLHKDFRGAKRKDGFQRALSDSGLNFIGTLEEGGPTSVESGRAMTASLVSLYPDLDTIYYASDDMALGGLCYCIENGISSPEQIALVGFNGLDAREAFPNKIASSITDRHKIGKSAATVLLQAMRDPDTTQNRKVFVKPRIDLGELRS